MSTSVPSSGGPHRSDPAPDATSYRRRQLLFVAVLLVLLGGVDLLLMDQESWTVAVAVLAAVLLAMLARAAGLDAADLGLSRERLADGLRVGGVLSALVLAGMVVATQIPALASAFHDERTPDELVPMLVKVGLVIPLRTVLLEELAFRGVLWGWLAKTRGEPAAVVGSSLAFGLWHVPPALVVLKTNDALSTTTALGSALVIGGIVAGTATAGLLFAELRRRTGSLAAPALLHWTVNSAGTVASYLLR